MNAVDEHTLAAELRTATLTAKAQLPHFLPLPLALQLIPLVLLYTTNAIYSVLVVAGLVVRGAAAAAAADGWTQQLLEAC